MQYSPLLILKIRHTDAFKGNMCIKRVHLRNFRVVCRHMEKASKFEKEVGVRHAVLNMFLFLIRVMTKKIYT